MISPQKIRIVYLKELRDILRDRRTLYSMILMPILLYPLLSIGMGVIVGSQIEKTRAAKQPLAILGDEYDPALAALIRNSDQFAIVPVEELRQGLLDLAAIDTTLDRAIIERLFASGAEPLSDSVRFPIFSRAIDERIIRAAVQIPPEFPTRVANGDSVELVILYDRSDPKSDAAGDKLRDWAIDYRDSLVAENLAALGLNRSLIKPFWIYRANVAPRTRMGGMILGMMLPYMLMILVLVGGMYPALDLTAGEKERNTLETLLAAPLSRFDIAAGKFLTTFTAAMVSMLLALTSMTLTAKYGFAKLAEGAIEISMSATAVFWLLFIMVPTATMTHPTVTAVGWRLANSAAASIRVGNPFS